MDIDGLGEKQVEPVHGARLGEDRRRLLPARPPSRSPSSRASARSRPTSSSRRSRTPSASRSAACCSRSGSRRSATSPAATSPSTSARSTRCSPPTPEQIEQTQGVGPKMAATIHEQLADEQMRTLIERPAASGAALRGGGPAAGRGPAGRQDVRAHRDAAGPDPRAGDRADHRRRRPGHRLGVAQDRLRRRRRERRLEARPGRAARACRCSTRPGCGRCCPELSRRTWRARRPSRPRPRARSPGCRGRSSGTRTRACGRRGRSQ